MCAPINLRCSFTVIMVIIILMDEQRKKRKEICKCSLLAISPLNSPYIVSDVNP